MLYPEELCSAGSLLPPASLILCHSIILGFFVCQLFLLPFYFLDVIGRAKKHSQPGVLMGKGGRK